MRRKLEFGGYAIFILFFILKYVDIPEGNPRSRAVPQPQQPAIVLPEDASLPRDIASTVEVKLERSVHNGVGTAFAVDGQGTYVTARHVVDGCASVYFVGGPGRLEPVASYASERTRDFAVIQAKRGPQTHLALSSEMPERGSDGYMMGYPQGNPADVRATVIGRTEMRSTGRYRMREPVVAWVERERKPYFGGSLGGISGGPVFDEAGNIIGTVVAGAPRRGRVYTTHPKVFEETGLVQASLEGYLPEFKQGIGRENYDAVGRNLRASRIIAQVYCKAR